MGSIVPLTPEAGLCAPHLGSTPLPVPGRSPQVPHYPAKWTVRREFFQTSRGERPVSACLISEGIPQNWLSEAGETFVTSYLTSLHDFSTKTGFLCLFGVANEVKLPSQASQLIVMLIGSCYLIYLWYRRLRTQMASDLGLVFVPLACSWGLLPPVVTSVDCIFTCRPPPRVSFYFREVLAVSKLIENIFK